MSTESTSEPKPNRRSNNLQSGTGLQVKTKSEAPLYMQVASILKDEIVNGIHPVGSLLPTEDSLCERFSVSRYTVREALRLLRDDNLVSSRRGAGTIVVPPSTADSDIRQVMSINDLAAFAADTRFAIDSIKMITIDAKLAAKTELEVGEEWLKVCGYRCEAEAPKPICWTEYYINRDFAAVGRLLQRHKGPVFPLIEDLFSQTINEVQQQISATLLPATLVKAFGEEEISAALEVRRTYKTTENKIAQVTLNVHPGSRYQHAMTMKRIKS